MNDEPTAGASSSRTYHDVTTVEEPALTPAQLKEKQKINRQTFNRKRALFLDDLLSNVDGLIFAELSAIYYMDCMFLIFALRALMHFVLLTPKNDSFPRAPEPQPYVGAIIGTNSLCLFLHLWLSAPTGSAALRGYLHGGLAMDFVGQKGPSSKVVLVLLDLLVTLLQVTQLCAHVARERLRTGASASTATTTTAAPSSQDLDSEERGIRRSEELAAQNDIELQPLTASGQAQAAPTSSPGIDSTAPQADALIFDAFYSGQIVLGDFNLWMMLKEQFWAYQKASPEARGASYRALLAGRMMGIRLARGGLR